MSADITKLERGKNFIPLLLFVSIMAALPLPIIEAYIRTKHKYLLVIAGILYTLLILGYIVILQKGLMSRIYPMAKVISVIIVVLLSIVIFKEKLDLKYLVGILLGLVSIYLLSK